MKYSHLGIIKGGGRNPVIRLFCGSDFQKAQRGISFAFTQVQLSAFPGEYFSIRMRKTAALARQEKL